MALQAKQVHVASPEQPRICRSVGRVACHASFCFDRRVLKGEGPGLVRVAGEAELVLRCCGPQLVRQKTAVWIVAVAAGNEPFVYFVVKWFGEVRLYILMAGEAKLGL